MASPFPERLNHVLQLTPIGTAAVATGSSNARSPLPTLAAHLASLSPVIGKDRSLPTLILALADATAEIARILRASHVAKLTSANDFGDQQLNVDVSTHECVLRHLRASGVCATASSEEDPVRIDLSDSLRSHVGRDEVYSVGFDPLDGSSIIDANFAVGSIFCLYAGRELLGNKVADQKACAISIYGPRTSMMIGVPDHVFEATLSPSGQWLISRPSVRIQPASKLFAPANLRCTTEDEAYRALVEYYMRQRYTLRYSGGLVPDFNHVLVKSNGVFISPISKSNPPKLRLVYECASLAMLSIWAGGEAVNQHGLNMRELKLSSYDARSGLVIGSRAEVHRFCEFRRKFGEAPAAAPSSKP